MSDAAADLRERRVLIFTPVGKDGVLIERMLHADQVSGFACTDADRLTCEATLGAGALLIAEEAYIENEHKIAMLLASQPTWSDLPVLMLTGRGADSPAARRAVETLGNVTLLERPVRVAALSSAVRSAIRARLRQYQIRTQLAEREIADRRKDEFLATLAHELRNPLAPIRNSVMVLRLSAASTEVSRVGEMIERQVTHMVRLVDDLTEVSRITRGAFELRRELVDVATALTDALETSRPLINAAQHELRISLDPVPMVLHADPLRLAQVFSNLINNAVKYTDVGGCITIRATRNDDHVEVRIRDTGIGISTVALGSIFEMFVQADVREGYARSGLGIGLTLVRSLVEMHGGTVSASSDGENCGSEFVVRLPLANAEVATSLPTSATGNRLLSRPRVLVVDDNADAATSLGDVLEMLGADVRVTHDGLSALAEVETFHPSAIFLDIGMPGMDGYEVATRIRHMPRDGDAVLVALTGWGQESDRRQTEAAGFDHHLVKPAEMAALHSVLASLTGGRV